MAILLKKVALRNYKSIAKCSVDLADFALLVGPNGAGKSNFIDAIRLVSDGLRTTLEHAIRLRGGISEVRRRSGGHPNHFNISFRLNLGDRDGFFGFQVGAQERGGFIVQREQASITTEGLRAAHYDLRNGEIHSASEELVRPPKVVSDRFFLTTVSGIEAFRPLFDALSRMAFYNINPAIMREPQPNDPGDILARDGANISAVIRRLKTARDAKLERIQTYLREIVPGIEGVDHKTLGQRETLEFRQQVQNTGHAWRFDATAMSDGTLRSLGVIVALFQFLGGPAQLTPLIAIEEPESTIHPAAAAVVMGAILEAAREEQVIATSHSPDLLDNAKLQGSQILAVRSSLGETTIAPVDEAAISAIRDTLYTPGELLRLGQLAPDHKKTTEQLSQSDLFLSSW
jgi:predicted ATPase